MARISNHVRLKFVDGFPIPSERNEEEEELAMLHLLDRTALSIVARGVYQLPDGLKVTVRTEADVEKIMSEKCKKMLLEIGLIPLASPEKLANQTIVIYTRSRLIHQSTDAQLIDEIKKQHANITVIAIWKDQRTGVLKITCNTNKQAEQLRSKELKLRGYLLMPEDLVQAHYIPVTQCLRCYRLNSHTSSACKDQQTYCGQCGQTGHRHTDCTSDVPQCINCIRANAPPAKRNHNARSNICPLKKKQLRKERQKLRGRSETPAGRPPVEFRDAPPPTSNAWGKPQNARSVSRSRRNRRRSRSSRKASVSNPPNGRNAPQPPTKTASESANAFPDLARNAKERKNKSKAQRNTTYVQSEQIQSASARLPAGQADIETDTSRMEHDELELPLARHAPYGSHPSLCPPGLQVVGR